MTQTTQAEIERRYANVRAAAAEEDGVDAVVVSGSEYTGFEGAVRYLSGFRILHRYAYVVVPVDGDPAVVFPQRGALGRRPRRGVDRGAGLRRAPGRVDRRPGARRGWRRIGVYGLDYVMAVRDYRALADGPARARRLRRAVRPRARGQVRRGARARAREHADQRGRRLGGARAPTRSARPRPS